MPAPAPHRRAAVAIALAICATAVACTPFGEAPSEDAPSGGSEESAGPKAGPAGAPPAPPPPSGLLLHYPLDEGTGLLASDASGLGHEGTLRGPTWGAGRRGGGLLFDGSSVIEVKTSPALSLAHALTVALSVRAAEASHNQRLVSRSDGWELKLNDRRPHLDGVDGNHATIEWNLPVSEWHHVAFTFDRGNVSGYVDGSSMPVENKFSTDTVGAGAGLLHVGATASADQGLEGMLDDVRIYARALSAQEIAALAN
jgi:hypothetical protein